MNQRKIESIIFSLTLEKDILLCELCAVEEKLNDETRPKDELVDLKKEQTHLIDDIKEIDLDIGVYEEMMSQLNLTEYSIENNSGEYDSRYEVLMEGDY